MAEHPLVMTDVETATEPLRAKQTQVARALDYRATYSNTARLRLTATDLSITFSLLTDTPEGAASHFTLIEEKTTILLPFRQVKFLALQLTAVADQMEKSAGQSLLEDNEVKVAIGSAHNMAAVIFKEDQPKK